MNTESKEYKKIVKKIGTPLYKAGDKVSSNMFEGVATVKGEPFYNGFVWMYYFNENEVGCGQEYLRSAYEWVAYNENTDIKPILFTGWHLAKAFVETQGAEWDFTDIKTFKSWYPEIIW
jgi:hypothetical protein